MDKTVQAMQGCIFNLIKIMIDFRPLKMRRGQNNSFHKEYHKGLWSVVNWIHAPTNSCAQSELLVQLENL